MHYQLGEYALVASASEDFSLNKNPCQHNIFMCQNISYVNNWAEYFILDRTTGKPLSGAKVQVWDQRYDTQEENIFLKNLNFNRG